MLRPHIYKLINVLKRKCCILADADATYMVLSTTGIANSVRRALALQLSSRKFLHAYGALYVLATAAVIWCELP